jgi:pimeloyl-ACP methyl ester carboxylesterase
MPHMPYAEVNGTILHYDAVGKGPSIVCIYPILLTGEIFGHQLASLSDRFQIITFDIRGHGKSIYSKSPLTHTLIADDICALLDMLGIEQAYLCGYSVGGQIALEARLAHPDRFKGAVLIGTMSELTGKIHRGWVWVTRPKGAIRDRCYRQCRQAKHLQSTLCQLQIR